MVLEHTQELSNAQEKYIHLDILVLVMTLPSAEVASSRTGEKYSFEV